MLGLEAQSSRPCFDLGGASFELRSSTSHWLWLARERYRGFETERSPRLRVSYTSEVGPPSLEQIFAARHRPIVRGTEGNVEVFAGSGFRARVEEAVASLDVEIRGPLATYPLDLLLEPLWYRLFSRGLILHGGLLACEGRGWLCCGPSGCGKSTLAGLFPAAALCDERVAVISDDEGRASAASLPFWTGRSGRADLCAIYVLQHGTRHCRRRLGPSHAMRRLTEHISWPVDGSSAIANGFDVLAELVAQTPVYELSFRPEPSVWDVLTREVAA